MPILTTYEQKFAVRQINWYSYPYNDMGLQAPTGQLTATSTATTPYQGTYTSAATAVFPYLNTATPLQIANATIYLAPPNPAAPAGTTVTPLIVDASGNALSLYITLAMGGNI